MATAFSNQPIDPAKGARFPITISEQLLREDRPKKRQRISVQCNRRSKLTSPFKSNIKPSPTDDSYDLSVSNDEKGEYKYNGLQHPSSTVALFYDPTEKSFTLDKLDAEFRFNLRSTPGQHDVRDTDPQLDDGVDNGDQDGDGLFGEESDDEDITPDANNPYDYRHFLNNNNKGNRSPSPVASYAASPVPQHTFHSSPALPATSIRSSQKPKPPISSRPPKSKPHSPKQKPSRYLSPKPHHRRDPIPTAASEEEDSDELVIDMGDSPPAPRPTTDRPWRSALSVLNEGGPVSLRSAASSMSPSLRGGSPSEDEGMGGRDDDEGDEEEGGSDADGDVDDGDVEEMDLRGDDDTVDAAIAAAPVEEAVTPAANNNGWDEDDDDELEAELALALEEDQAKSDIEVEEARAGRSAVNGMNGGGGVGNGAESSEESEEE